MLFLADLDGVTLDGHEPGPWREVRVLRDGLVLIASDASRSVVYHALKDHLEPGGRLLVTRLHEVPKFRGMAPGSLAWARRQPLD